MNKKVIGIIGLGRVGEGVLKSLHKYATFISRRADLKIVLKKICDKDDSRRSLAEQYQVSFTSDPSQLLRDPEIDIIVELIGGLEPARTIILEALRNGKNVVTANKALLATSGKTIFAEAMKSEKRVGFEAAVCGAIPLVKSTSEGLIACDVRKIYGILNGTTNYILDKMRKENLDFATALKEAQACGYAEQKPDLDINGIDTLHKLCILSYLHYGIWPPLEQVYAEGISRISLVDVLHAQELHYTIKLLAIAKKDKESLDLRVHPALIARDHPLAQVSLAYNAVYFDTKPAGELLFYGEGAGGVSTSASVLSDIVSIASGNKGFTPQEEKLQLKNIRDIQTRYYMRCMAVDRPGVLAEVSKILAHHNISIASVTQKERNEGTFVPIVMLTHQVKENDIRKALSAIDQLKTIKSPSQILRIEDL